MSKSGKSITLLSIALAVSLATAFAYQDHDTEKQEQRSEKRAQHMQEQLNLTNEQAYAIKTLKQQHRQDYKQITEKYGLKKGANTPKQQLDKEQLQAFRQERKSLHEKFNAKIANILNEEQLAQWQNMRVKHKEYRK